MAGPTSFPPKSPKFGAIRSAFMGAVFYVTQGVRTSQVVTESLTVGSPGPRVSQVTPEAMATGSPIPRVTQVVVEGDVVGSPQPRVTQIVVEALIANLEVVMPPVYPTLIGLSYSVTWSPQFFGMPTQKTSSGAELDLALSQDPLHSFELVYSVLSDQFGKVDFKRLMGFFLRVQGSIGRFLFKNPDDHNVQGQVIGTTDGSAHVWKLVRTFGVGDDSGTEAVGYLDQTQPFNVYLDGLLQAPSSYDVLTTEAVNQQIDFHATPGGGKQITVDMEYFYYCKFIEPILTFEKFVHQMWEVKKVPIQSCRAGT